MPLQTGYLNGLSYAKRGLIAFNELSEPFHNSFESIDPVESTNGRDRRWMTVVLLVYAVGKFTDAACYNLFAGSF